MADFTVSRKKGEKVVDKLAIFLKLIAKALGRTQEVGYKK